MVGPKHNIALVLPDPTARRAATGVLRAGGYEVSTAADYESAKKLIEGDRSIDLAVIAIKLGVGLSGFVLLRELRHNKPDRPVVVVANEPELEDVRAAFRLGAEDVLLEPIRSSELLCVVDRAYGLAANEAAERSGLNTLGSGAYPRPVSEDLPAVGEEDPA